MGPKAMSSSSSFLTSTPLSSTLLASWLALLTTPSPASASFSSCFSSSASRLSGGPWMLDSSPPFQESWELGELWQKKNTKVRSKSNQMSIALESKRRHLQATATLQHLHSPGLHRSCIQLDLEEQDFFLPSILSLFGCLQPWPPPSLPVLQS